MSRHPRADLYIRERESGLTYREIAEKHGVSFQAVVNACGRHAPGRFKPFTASQVVYPNLRRWLNENKVGKFELIRRMGNIANGGAVASIGRWLRGDCYPSKLVIDKLIAATGLTYEQLFETGDGV